MFLPLFASRAQGAIQSTSLLALTEVEAYLKIIYYVVVIAQGLLGILTLGLQTIQNSFWLKHKSTISFIASIISVLLFVVSLQPYAAVFLFIHLSIKASTLIKLR
jgi:hypothetical protein